MTRRRAIVITLATALIALLLLSKGMHAGLLRILDAAQAIAEDHPLWAAALVVVFAALAAMLAFVSSWVIVAASLVLITNRGRLPGERQLHARFNTPSGSRF